MSRRFLLAVFSLALLSLCLANAGFAQKKGKGSKQSCKQGAVLQDPIPVTITFREGPTDKITDDFDEGPDPYDADANAVIDCWGRIFMSSSFPEPGPRKIKLDFSNGPKPAFGDVVVVPFTFKATIPADDCGGSSSTLDIAVGSSCPARGNVSFDDPKGGKWDYAVRFNSNEPSSNNISVTRLDPEMWTMEATDGEFANLVQYVRNKSVFTGPYTLPFLATVKCANTGCVP